MDSVSAIALSGLTAAGVRLGVSASNVANAGDTAPGSGSAVAGSRPFVPTRVSLVGLGTGGVQAQLSAADPASAVDLASERVEQLRALQQYRASAAVLKVADRLQRTAIERLG